MITPEQQLVEQSTIASRKASEVYEDIESSLPVIHNEFFKDLVCPKNWQDHPFDRWFKLKEGYASVMVRHLLEEFQAARDEWVLDPFLGSGSTLVGARAAGVNGLGFEVNPFLASLSRTKMHLHDPDVLATHVRAVLDAVKAGGPVRIEPPALTITGKLFKHQLDAVLRAKQAILDVEDPHAARFLLAGLGCILERVSYAKKDGNGLKYPKQKQPLPFLETLEAQYALMLEDVRARAPARPGGRHVPRHLIFNGDSRSHSIESMRGTTGIDAGMLDDALANTRYAIFSPPYANCFDYTEVYKIELWMLDFITEYPELKRLREASVSSHLNKTYVKDPARHGNEGLEFVLDLVNWDKTFGKWKTRAMVSAYFDDMVAVFRNIDRILQGDGTIVCIVGNSAYGNVPIATDLFLGQALHDMGYENVEIRVARQLGTSSQQQKIMGRNPYLRESLVIASSR